jgi:hypothetical protein
MTSPVGRMYATALTLFTFFLAWALVAAKPWPEKVAASADPRLVALQAREVKLRRESIQTRRLVQRRWATYRAQLAKRNQQIAAAAAPPSVRIVTAPPTTVTRTS